jgi:hypothetical protein
LRDRGLDDPDDPERCVLRRIITKEGRSRAFINGAPATLSDLTDLARTLIDIHSQNEHQSLLRRDVQLDLLDHYAGLEDLAGQTRAAYRTAAAAERLSALELLIEQSRDRRTCSNINSANSLNCRGAGEYEDGSGVFGGCRRAKTSRIVSGRHSRCSAVKPMPGQRVSTTSADRNAARRHRRCAPLPAAAQTCATALTHFDESAHELRRYLEISVPNPTRWRRSKRVSTT